MERSEKDLKQPTAFLTFLLAVYGVAFVGYLGARRGLHGWYDALLQPPGTPAPWIFGPVWSVLYVLIGLAGWRIWKGEHSKARTQGLCLFGLQLILNSVWTWLFFALEKPLPAFFELVVLWMAVLLTMLRVRKVDITATWFLLPYLLWLTFAAYLNIGIWNLNYRDLKAPGHVDTIVTPM